MKESANNQMPEMAPMPTLKDLPEQPVNIDTQNTTGEKITPTTNESSQAAATENLGEKIPGATKEQSLQSIGEARYKKIGESIANAKKNLGTLFKTGATKMGRVFKGALFGVLAAPEAISRGIDKAGEGMDKVNDYMNKKADQFNKWQEGVEKITNEKIAEVRLFAKTKKENLVKAAKEKAVLAETIAIIFVQARAEELSLAKDGLVKAWDNTIDYGINAIVSAELARQEIKKRYNRFIHEIKLKYWERKAQKDQEKLDKTKKKLADLQKFDEIEKQLTEQPEGVAPAAQENPVAAKEDTTVAQLNNNVETGTTTSETPVPPPPSIAPVEQTQGNIAA